jgi:hypothetical protein
MRLIEYFNIKNRAKSNLQLNFVINLVLQKFLFHSN